MDLNVGPAFSRTFDASFDLSSILPSGINFGSGLLSGAANLETSGSADIALSFGIDLKIADEIFNNEGGNLNDHIFLLDSTAAGNKTGISGSLSAVSEDLTFQAGLGPFGILINEGKVRIGGGLLSGDANFSLNLSTSSGPVIADIIIPKVRTTNNKSINDMVDDINDAFGFANLGSYVTATTDGVRFILETTGVTSMQITAAANDPAVTELGFDSGQTLNENSKIIAARLADLKVFSLTPKAEIFTGHRVYGKLSGDAVFTLDANGHSAVVTVKRSKTIENTTVADLKDDINAALTAAGLAEFAVASFDGNKLVLSSKQTDGTITLTAVSDNPTVTEMGFKVSQSGTGSVTAKRDVVSAGTLTLSSLLTDFSFSKFDAALNGTFDATLPLYFPTESIYKGDIVLNGFLKYNEATGEIDPGWKIINPSDGDLSSMFSIDPAMFSLMDKILFAVDGVDMFLGGLQTFMEGGLFGFKLPLIGDQLAKGAHFIEDFREGFVASLRDELKNTANPDKNFISEKLFEFLGTSIDAAGKKHGAGVLLQDRNHDGNADLDEQGNFKQATLASDVWLKTNVDTPGVKTEDAFIEWKMKLGQNMVDQGADISFDLGLPGFGIETEGEINLDIDWELSFGFGVSWQEGFYLIIDDGNSSTPDFKIDLTMDLAPETKITGKVGVLQLQAVDKDMDHDGDSTHLSAGFAIDIINKSEGHTLDTKLAFGDLSKLKINPLLKAEAAAELGLTLGVTSDLGRIAKGMPKMTSDFIVDWKLGNGGYVDLNTLTRTDLGKTIQNGLKRVEFVNINMDLGSFAKDVLGPIVDKVQSVTKPFQPIIDIVTAPLPVLKNLGIKLTFLDLADMFGYCDADMIYAIADIITLANQISTMGDGLMMNFGNFTVYDAAHPEKYGLNFDLGSAKFFNDKGKNGFDKSFAEQVLHGNLKDLVSGIKDEAGFEAALSSLGVDTSKGTFQTFNDKSNTTSHKNPWSFPIFKDPMNVFGLLMGKDVVLVGYDMPKLSFNFQWSQFFPIISILGISVNVEFGVDIDLAFGYDTHGIKEFIDGGYTNPALVLDGLYISDDPKNPIFVKDDPELVLHGGLWAAVELNVGFARAGIGGGIFAKVEFNLYDPNHDGKIRMEELLTNIENEWNYGNKAKAPLAIFDVTGKLTAELFVFVEIKLVLKKISFRVPIAPPITLLSYTMNFQRPPVLATELPDGTLQLNIGRHAAERINGNLSDISETISVTSAGAGYVYVSSSTLGGRAQKYKVKGKIYAEGGLGNDVIDLSGVTDPNIAFEIFGDFEDEAGGGSDTIRTGGGNATIRGGVGKDYIYGGLGSDVIYGEAGADILDGGGGNDLIFGGDGEIGSDYARVDASDEDADTIYGSAGDDILFGGGKVDTIHGGTGNDLIIGDDGQVNFVNKQLPKDGAQCFEGERYDTQRRRG